MNVAKAAGGVEVTKQAMGDLIAEQIGGEISDRGVYGAI